MFPRKLAATYCVRCSTSFFLTSKKTPPFSDRPPHHRSPRPVKNKAKHWPKTCPYHALTMPLIMPLSCTYHALITGARYIDTTHPQEKSPRGIRKSQAIITRGGSCVKVTRDMNTVGAWNTRQNRRNNYHPGWCLAWKWRMLLVAYRYERRTRRIDFFFGLLMYHLETLLSHKILWPTWYIINRCKYRYEKHVKKNT